MNFKISNGTEYLKKNDRVLNTIILKYGACNLKPSKSYFEDLVRSIISQQLSSKASATIHNRFSEMLRNEITPENVLKLNQKDFKSVGVSIQKTNYLKHLSKIYLEDKSIFDNFSKLNNDQIIHELVKIKGIGQWTAQMFLIFSMNRLNVLPLDDIGIKNSLKIHYKLRKHPNEKKMLTISKNWGEYSSIAVWYLWKALDNQNGKVK